MTRTTERRTTLTVSDLTVAHNSYGTGAGTDWRRTRFPTSGCTCSALRFAFQFRHPTLGFSLKLQTLGAILDPGKQLPRSPFKVVHDLFERGLEGRLALAFFFV